MTIDQSIFKAYDIRGIVPDQINEEVAEQIGRAYAIWIQNSRKKKIISRKLEKSNVNGQLSNLRVAVGRDVRIHSPNLSQALIRGLISQSADVVDAGVISTPMLYFIVGSTDLAGGITVTASHNDKEYNGFKLVREQAIPLSGDSGIKEIGSLASQDLSDQGPTGQVSQDDYGDRYLDHLQKLIPLAKLSKQKILINPNFGAVSQIWPKIEARLPGEFIYLNNQPDGTFPKGKPDPMTPENKLEMFNEVKKNKVDFGVAFDADGDRVFFYDETGQFIDGYYTTALLAQSLLITNPGSKIIHDPRLTWATIKTVKENGGLPLINKVGHSFFKERMRSENAVFAGENSGHYYFRDHFFADDGLLGFLYMWLLISKKGQKLSELVQPLKEKYPISGEINFTVSDPAKVLEQVKKNYPDGQAGNIDGTSIEYKDWRFNLRSSNTEPLVRLNIEARTKDLVEEKVKELTNLINSLRDSL